MADNSLEIPQALRDASEQNLKQAHAAYEQFTALALPTGQGLAIPPSLTKLP